MKRVDSIYELDALKKKWMNDKWQRDRETDRHIDKKDR